MDRERCASAGPIPTPGERRVRAMDKCTATGRVALRTETTPPGGPPDLPGDVFMYSR